MSKSEELMPPVHPGEVLREDFMKPLGLTVNRLALELHVPATPTKIPSDGLSKRLQGHFVTQAFQPPDQGSADSVHVDPVKVVRTEFPVVFLTLQHVIGNN